ncbi:TolC family protein [Novosphingobium sp. MW5]|nr:TolC family protein [Novosphingobium sp. MW5]
MAETALQGPTHFRDFDVHLKLLYKTNLYLGAQGWLALAFLSATVGEPAAAEDLDSAIKAAAEFSPLLTSARSRLEGCAAEVTIARAEGLPTVNGTLRYSKELGKYPGAGDGFAAETSVNIPLFRGGSVRNGVKSSEAQCDASSASISEVESEVTLMLTKAYAEVITNRKIVTLNREAVTNLSAMLEGVQQRLRARDLTRTDVDQAQSRLSLARGRLETALAALESSDAEFQRLTGRKPADLLPLPSISGIPLTADAAIEIAVAENPGVIAARSEAQATRFSLNSAKGDLLPQVYATANSNYGETPQNSLSQGRYAFGTTVGVGMRMSFLREGGKMQRCVQLLRALLRPNSRL